MTGEPEIVWDVQAQLGEGPVWSARERCVWFVDINDRENPADVWISLTQPQGDVFQITPTVARPVLAQTNKGLAVSC